jgi:3-hydroxyacyl-CoA dehydrogenase
VAHLFQPVVVVAGFGHQAFGGGVFQLLPPQAEKQRAIADAGHELVHPQPRQGSPYPEDDNEDGKNLPGQQQGATNLEKALASADFVIEAVPEDLKIKMDLFKTMDAIVAKD